MGFLLFLIVGLIAGWLASELVKGSDYGVVGDMIVGVVGALIGGFIFEKILGVSSGGGIVGSIIVATIGAILFIYALRLIKRATR